MVKFIYLLFLGLLFNNYLYAMGESPFLFPQKFIYNSKATNISIPEFEVIDIDKHKPTFLSEYIFNSNSLIYIFTTWNPYFTIETKILNDLYNKYSQKGIKFIGVSFDKEDISFLNRYLTKIKFPVVLGSSEFLEYFQLQHPSGFILVDKNMKFIKFITDFRDLKSLKEVFGNNIK